jgi:hypothetical protein
MRHWQFHKGLPSSREAGIALKLNERVVSLSVPAEGYVCWYEECDGCYQALMSKEVALETLREAIAWLENPDGHDRLPEQGPESSGAAQG